MGSWIVYGLTAALLIASRDMFTKIYANKYSVTEHLLYYYMLCGIFVAAYACYKKFYLKEKIKIIQKDDLWKYAIVAAASVLIISPCEALSIRKCSNPGQARALTNLSTLILFVASVYFFKTEEITTKKIIGILMAIGGVALVVV